MFLNFFYELRAHGIPVSTREYLDFVQVMNSHGEFDKLPNLQNLYDLARITLVKDVKFYDAYDLAFAKVFAQYEGEEDFQNKLKQWLEQAKKNELSDQRKAEAMKLLEKDIVEELKKRLEEQKERHDGGNYWIGTGGTSAFGNSGFNSQGIRVGGQSGARSAIAVAGERNFKDYRSDLTLNTRNIKVALKKVKQLRSVGKEKVNINQTIKKTVKNLGDIDIVFSREKKNNLKLILLMDVGGSMTPYAESVNKLFSSAHNLSHFKQFKALYFHNIFYDKFYLNAQLRSDESLSFEDLKKKYPKDTRIIIVGDAYMAPYELFRMTGSMMDFYRSFSGDISPRSYTGIESLEKLRKRYKNIAWLNPEPRKLWEAPTIKAIRTQVNMYELTIDGINKACSSLV
jgi:uncharacterized protein with von Willebrand factor type A (vWA) domain